MTASSKSMKQNEHLALHLLVTNKIKLTGARNCFLIEKKLAKFIQKKNSFKLKLNFFECFSFLLSHFNRYY